MVASTASAVGWVLVRSRVTTLPFESAALKVGVLVT